MWWAPDYVESDDEPEPAPFRLEQALDTLTSKQRFVIELRFGLKDGEFYTLEEIAEVMGIAVPNVWKHEAAALKRLRKTG